jgi:xylulokinase
MHHLLGIDLGTTDLKATIFDVDGGLLGRGRCTNEYLAGPVGWAEQDPRTWWSGCCRAIRQAMAQSGLQPEAIAGIGVCGFHHCPVFLGADGEPARATVVTHDRRLGGSLADLQQSGVLAEVVRISGSQVVTGHFPSIYHLVQQEDSGALEHTRWILLAKDYLRFRLTGEIGTEICDATGTHLVAMPEQAWSGRLCSLLNVPRRKLPEIGQSDAVAGYLSKEAAEETGLRLGTPVVYGGGDSHCALVGLGVVGSGEAGLLLGTNSTLRASFDGLVRARDKMVWVQQHVVPGRFTASASSMAGSSVLSWFKNVCSDSPQDGADVYRRLDSLAARVPPGSEGLLFHPYLFGERSPFYNADAGGAFLALRSWHGKGHLVRSIMEGVAFSIANCLDAIGELAGEDYGRLAVIRTGQSGGSQLPVWRQIIANVLDQPLELIAANEPGCLGAALLAGAGVGLLGDVETAARRVALVACRITPEAVNADLYRERRTLFNDTYRALEPTLYAGSTVIG